MILILPLINFMAIIESGLMFLKMHVR